MSPQNTATEPVNDPALPASAGPARGCGHEREDRLSALEAERMRLGRKIVELQTEQQRLLERYVGLEEQNSVLTTLYVAFQRLHSSLDRAEVLLTLREVLANLVGCEEYALFSLAADGSLRSVDSVGVDPHVREEAAADGGLIRRTVETGQAYQVDASDGSASTGRGAPLTACIPLKRQGTVAGALALFRLLPQKSGLQELDRELFEIFETHLARVLYCAELHASVKTRNGVTA